MQRKLDIMYGIKYHSLIVTLYYKIHGKSMTGSMAHCITVKRFQNIIQYLISLGNAFENSNIETVVFVIGFTVLKFVLPNAMSMYRIVVLGTFEDAYAL
jgi:hypothetical protein